jgi:hypothetical protein
MKKTNLLLSLMLVLVALGASAANVPVSGNITTNTSWTNDNIYILFGDVVVKSGATLTIQEGTIIKGDKGTGGKLVITIGSKINAQGSASKPIVFTSNQPAGQRARGDWGGVAILGDAPTNIKDANGNSVQGLLECGTAPDFNYGGSDAADNSGVLSYVRIEYAGFVCGTNTEFNSLAMAGVGSGTKIDHVQVSFGQDDGFEWWGGNSNPTHLISIGSRDDDFDTDNGFIGKVQFGLIIRVDTIADQGDISNGFESDNDANGSYNTPYTAPVFSNITIIGPAQTLTSTIDAKYGWAYRLRRNTATSVFNSLVVGYKRGLRIEGSGSQGKATGDTLEFKYNIIEGSVEKAFESSFDSAYLANALTNNTIYGGQPNATVNMVAPYAANRDFRLQTGSPALTGANFTSPKLATGFTTVAYKGAFGGTDDWTASWANFNPQLTDYSTPTGIQETAVWSELSVVPNPTSGNATLLVTLQDNADLTVSVYDMFGKFISNVDKGNFATGSHRISINTENLQSGVYFVNVAAGERNSAVKMIVAK